MTKDYAYKSITAALRAAFTPASPYYGSGALNSMVASHDSSPDRTTPQDRMVQAGQVFAFIKRTVSDIFIAYLMVKFIAPDAVGIDQVLTMVATHLSRVLASKAMDLSPEFVVDVLRREAHLKPLGSFTADWPRWSGHSVSSVYRHRKIIQDEFNGRLDLIYSDLGAEFELRGVCPNV